METHIDELLKRIVLIDHYLVEVREASEETTTPTGIIIPGEEKPTNFGTVLAVPSVLTAKPEDKILIRNGEHKQEVLFTSIIRTGDTVFFPFNTSVNVIEVFNSAPGVKYILLPKEYIQAVIPSNSEDA